LHSEMADEPVEWLPLRKEDGEINRDLMSFARLYTDEIVHKIYERYDDRLIKGFLDKLKLSDLTMEKDNELIEWLVLELVRSKEGFEALYKFLEAKAPALLNTICMKNESLQPKVMKPFLQFFLCTAPDLTTMALKEIVEDMYIDEDADDDVVEDSDEYEYEDETLDSDDTLPPDYQPKKKKKEKVEKVEPIIVKNRYDYEDTVLDKIAAVFDPEFALSTLERAYSSLRQVVDPLSTPSNAASMNARPWARAILRQLPRMAPTKEELDNFPSIVFNFANACKNDPYNRVALSYLMPDYITQLISRDASLRARNTKGGKKMEMIDEEKVAKQCRPPEDYEKERRAPIREYQSTAMPIHLREYQKELVEKANKGINTVIVAPTGSGKTVVAAQIMRSHVMRRRADKKPSRMVMVVPKIPLVEQQQKQLYQYMADVVYSDILHGDMMFEEQAKIEKILCAELIVMTPQILINLLESVRQKERLFVADITMLILDECHHCCSNHPYAQLMSIVRAWKHDRPQIVGLTASLGVGKDGSLNESSAHDHVVELMARMTATALSTVVQHKRELNDHVQLPIDDIKDVQRGTDNTVFSTAIEDYMTQITRRISDELRKMSRPGNNSGALIPQSLVHQTVDYKETERYGGRIEALKQAIRTMNNGGAKSELNMALDILKVCNMTLGMNDLLPASHVFPQMKKEMRAICNRKESHPFINLFKELETKLEKIQYLEDDKEMLRTLRSELQKQFKKNADSKVIIFVATRELSQAVSDYINERRDGIGIQEGRDAGFIISSKARGVGTVSQTPIEQRNAIANFRNNKLAVLVSTTVAEEGLDVPECNLIIKYNMTGNVISLTQQRGRARAKDSKSVLIVLSGSVKKRELENANAEKMMNHIVNKIHQEGGAKLEAQVKRATEMMEMEEKKIEMENKMKMESLQANNFEVVCVSCNQYLCPSYKIKNGASHYFAVDPSIWEYVKLDQAELKSKYIDVVTTVVGKALCKGDDGKCGADLGKVVRYHGCYMPALKCVSLQLKNMKTNQLVGMDTSSNKKRAWKEVADTHFYISKIDDHDVAEMMDALSMRNLELFEILEARCREICRKTRREAERKFDSNKSVDETRDGDSD
ncbi:hypothetical protein PFISCL1PPCAC_10350, partial [Pristionchus fissidentatus]